MLLCFCLQKLLHNVIVDVTANQNANVLKIVSADVKRIRFVKQIVIVAAKKVNLANVNKNVIVPKIAVVKKRRNHVSQENQNADVRNNYYAC